MVVAGALLVWVGSGRAQSPNAFGTPSSDQATPGATIPAVPGSRAQGWLAQGRSEVLARHGIVATSDPLAAQAGLDILRQGGNAIDAAVAAGAVLDVTSQNDTGIGGDLFALIWSAKDKKLYALNSAGWAPAAWTPEFFTEKLQVRSVPGRGVNATTVPGAISGYDAMLKRFGTFTFKETLERAARLADEGWGQAERRHFDLVHTAAVLVEDADSRRTFLVDDRAPSLYAIIRNPSLARALRLIQQDGRDAFYRGDIAKALVEMLNILEVCVPKLGFSLAALGPANPMYWHFVIEAKKLAYADLLAHNADPKFSAVPVSRLISKQYAETLCSRINPNTAARTDVPASTDGGTIYLTTADRWGNMVSLIHSVYSEYGSGATVGRYGFVLQNRGTAFSLDPRSPNVVAPRKRPFHTIIAGFVMKDGQPHMTFGNMGRTVQPETHAQHMVNLIDLGMNVQMTTDAARLTHSQSANVVQLEVNLFDLVGSALRAKGHDVRAVTGAAVGGYQGILFTRDPALPEPVFDRRSVTDDRPVNGVYRAGSDHRKDGHAAGW
jgi:gamma-glutamyltranspeptidase/glutathione hydrolase